MQGTEQGLFTRVALRDLLIWGFACGPQEAMSMVGHEMAKILMP